MKKESHPTVHPDLAHLWYPCSQMKDYEQFLPKKIRAAQGSYIELEDGRRIIDAIASWWCKSLGHGHPKLKSALSTQMEKFEHVILANTTHDTILALSEKLAQLTAHLNKVMYASDGSCAIEMAMKMSLHARQIQGEIKRDQFMSLTGAYHGETSGALAISQIDLYRDPYKKMLIKTHCLQNIPYVSSREDPLWSDCSKRWHDIEQQLAPLAEQLTAIIVEPIVQGAKGMWIYSAHFLYCLKKWCEKNHVHLIADEIMTGFGRTGKMLACEHANIEPDFLCLSKGICSGFLPISAMLTSDGIYELFYDDYEKNRAFLHAHTHTGNALAAAVSLACIECMQTDNILQQVTAHESTMKNLMIKTKEETGRLENLRYIGGVIAADLITDDSTQRLGYQVFQAAVQRGAWLRPLGNTIYWLPPLNIETKTLVDLQMITRDAINAVFK